ncbi:PRD domain-containing protein [Holdemania massiliensis]|uniref:PRD domain-containing protein n=1 Tax=Holdemania massiliensis TaxID=1468449 RepID=UPI001F055470|nr:PRD domain-containing protein [Holdemania massiliensis]MCH1941941.1 PRD domain-containing protein [Holdemania massiliensis]
MQESKQQIHELIKNATLQFLKTGVISKNTKEIADQFHLSRSVVSKYLNTLFIEEKLIKISTRPVIYFDRLMIENELDKKISASEYISISEFKNELNQISKKEQSFLQVIGKDGSLRKLMTAVESMIYNQKTNILLLCGEAGTGKSYLAKIIYEFLCSKDSQMKEMIKISCTEGNHDYQELIFNPITGLFYKTKNGLLLFENFGVVNKEIQKEIIFRIKNLLNQKELKLNWLIFTVSDENLIDTSLFNEIDFSFNLPRLIERPVKEREAFIVKKIKLCEHNLKKQIYISRLAHYSLVHFDYAQNLITLNQTIETLIVNANKEQDHPDKICIFYYHLPIEIVKEIRYEGNAEQELYSSQQLSTLLFHDRLITTAEEIKEEFKRQRQCQSPAEEFLKYVDLKLNQYCDYLVFEKQENDNKIQIMENVVKSIFEVIESKYNSVIDSSVMKMLARFLFENTYIDINIRNWEIQNIDFINELDVFIQNNYFLENTLLNEIDNRIFSMLEMRMDFMSKLYLAMNLNGAAMALEQLNKIGILVAHGYSSATSIAESVNRLLGVYVFKGIDMPLETNTNEIVMKIRNYILSRAISKEIILLVDMGSLEQIGQEVANYASVNVGMINNISTKTALSAGYGIIHNQSIQEILDTAAKANHLTSHVFGSKVKKKAIVFTFDSGLQSTERVMQIFKTSMPKKTDIQFITFDYVDLMNQEKAKKLVEKYDVIMIVGTYSTQIEIAPYIALEDIISVENLERLYSLMKNMLSNEEIKQLNANLLRNFSLENIMQNLTILNPTTLINFIDEALKKLQRELKQKFSSKVMAGLYLHISSMVERLVTKQPEIPHEDLDEFQKEQVQFIHLFRICFQELMKHYNIEISLAEIAYLHDYIENGFTYQNTKDKNGGNRE